MKVYILQGWFGDVEWVEGVYTSKKRAKAECARLWETRRTGYWPEDDYRQGVCKFDVWTEETK